MFIATVLDTNLAPLGAQCPNISLQGAVDENGSGVSISISSLRDDEVDFLCKPVLKRDLTLLRERFQ